MPLAPDTIIRRSEAILSNDLGDEMVMMDIDRGAYFGLDPVGARIFTLAEQPVSVKSLCEQLVSEYDISPEQCEKEVSKFLDELLDKEIIEIVESLRN